MMGDGMMSLQQWYAKRTDVVFLGYDVVFESAEHLLKVSTVSSPLRTPPIISALP